jgi:hypothetical protein
VATRVFPKSNASLRPGDFCFVPRKDGRAAIFVFLFPQGTSRRYFFGALANCILEEPQAHLIPAHVDLGGHALVHIKCFEENDTPIAGNIIHCIDTGALDALNAKAHKYDVGTSSLVWGYRTIVTKANALTA